VISFAASFALEIFFSYISAGTRTIFLTILIAGAAAILKPIEEKEKSDGA